METQSTSVNSSRATRWRLLALGAVAVGVLAALLVVLDDGAEGDSPATLASTAAPAAESDQTTSSAGSGSTQDTVESAPAGDITAAEDRAPNDGAPIQDSVNGSEVAQAGADPVPTDQASPGEASDQANLALIELSGSLQAVFTPTVSFAPSDIPDFDPASWRFDLVIDPTSATAAGTVSIPAFEGSGIADTQVGVGPHVAATLGGFTLSFTDAAIVDAPGPLAEADAAVQTSESVPFTVTWACGLVSDDASVLTGKIGITIGPESIFLSAGIHLTASDYQDFVVDFDISFGFRPTDEQRLQIEQMRAGS